MSIESDIVNFDTLSELLLIAYIPTHWSDVMLALADSVNLTAAIYANC